MIKSWKYRGVVGVAVLIVVISMFGTEASFTRTIQFTEAAWVAVGLISLIVHVGETRASRREKHAVAGPSSWDPYVRAERVIAAGHHVREIARTVGQSSFIFAGVAGMPFAPHETPEWLVRATLLMLHVGQIVWLLTAASEAAERDELGDIREGSLVRLEERQEDRDRQDGIAAAALAATDRLEAKADDAARTLDVIHTLVNSRLTKTMEATLVSLHAQLTLLRNSGDDTEGTRHAITRLEAQIGDLEATLEVRAKADEAVAKQADPGV